MTYSIIGILAAIIQLIINQDVLFRRSRTLAPTQRVYRAFLLGVLAYYVTDALWGILDMYRLTALQYADTALYFAAMAAAVLLWTRYVIAYLGGGSRFAALLRLAGNMFFAFEIVVVVINFFTPILFSFDGAGAYHAGSARYVTLIFQILMFLLTSIYTLQISLRSEGSMKLRHMTIGLFGIAMMALIALQIAYPLWPFYAMGYMLGICLMHSFVVEDEKEERRRALVEALGSAEQANRAKTTFLNNMSHDIRTPMNAIVGFTALAGSHLDDRELVRDYLGKISVSSQHLLSLINDVLDMSRIESGRMTLEESEVHLPDLIAELSAIVQAGVADKGLSLTIDTEGLVDEDIITDRLRLNQVLLNILSNAIKYTPEGGSIRFAATQDPSDREGSANLVFSVKDTGIGMSEAFQKTIFEAFTREQNSTVSGIQGTGLGMAITKNIVDMMGGSIAVTSAPGSGSEFIVRLPCRVNTAKLSPGESGAPVEGPADFSGMRVLLAEDNEMNQMIATEILSQHGFEVEIARDGVEAVEMMAGTPAGHFDVILMDVQMPRMDGHEAARRIRAMEDPAKAGIPIVAVTANAFEEDRQSAMDAGMDGHLAKPYDIPRMMETLARLLKARSR